MPCYIWCEIVCVDCAGTIAGQHTSGAIPRCEMSKEARAYGWVLTDDWRCPDCAKYVKRKGDEQ